MEALGILRGTEICIAEDHLDVAFKTDAKYVTSMIKGKTYPSNSYTGECVFFLRVTLQKEHWRLIT
jgi:hypothetical protein